MKGCFFRCKNSLGQPQSHVLFYSNDDLFGSVSCRFSLISKYNIPFAKAVLLKEVIVYLLMGTFVDELPKNFNIFCSSGRQN